MRLRQQRALRPDESPDRKGPAKPLVSVVPEIMGLISVTARVTVTLRATEIELGGRTEAADGPRCANRSELLRMRRGPPGRKPGEHGASLSEGPREPRSPSRSRARCVLWRAAGNVLASCGPQAGPCSRRALTGVSDSPARGRRRATPSGNPAATPPLPLLLIGHFKGRTCRIAFAGGDKRERCDVASSVGLPPPRKCHSVTTCCHNVTPPRPQAPGGPRQPVAPRKSPPGGGLLRTARGGIG